MTRSTLIARLQQVGSGALIAASVFISMLCLLFELTLVSDAPVRDYILGGVQIAMLLAGPLAAIVFFRARGIAVVIALAQIAAFVIISIMWS
ncbi:MAG: hypothetical protein ABIR08_01195 [Sphingomonas sp.]